MLQVSWLVDLLFRRMNIFVTIFFTAFVAIVSNWVTKRQHRSVKQKERQQALGELNLIIEGLVINNREALLQDPDLDELGLSSDRIEDLIEAAEREYDVLLPEATPVTLLQDVDLSIKDSRHLDSEQKTKHSEAIGNAISQIQDDDGVRVALPPEGAMALENISENADYEGSQEDVATLKENVTVFDPDPSPSEFRDKRRFIVAMAATMTAIISVFLQSPDNSADPLSQTTFLMFTGLILSVLFALLVATRIDDRRLGGILGEVFR